MFKTLFSLIWAVMLLIPCIVLAQETTEVTLEPIVVTATRIEVPLEEVGKTVTVVTAEQLEEQKATSLVEALQNIPGLLVRRQQGPGGIALIKIRGLDTEYTQILIDGLPVRDPSEPQGSAVEFMSDILVENIERIEVVRGSSSTLYGSDSVGGTINIITKKRTGKPGVFASFEGGSMSTFQEVVGTQGMAGSVNYSLVGKRIDSDGLDDHDTYRETSAAGRFGIDFSQDVSLMMQVKYTDSDTDLNNSPGILDGVLIKDQDDPDDTKKKTLVNSGVVFSHNVSEKFDYNVKLGYVDVDKKFTFGPQGDEFGFGSKTTYAGNIFNAEAQANYSLNDANLLTVGYEYETEEFEQVLGEQKDTPNATQHGAYFQDSLALMSETLNIVPGVRYVNHDQAGDRVDWEISASYMVGESGVRLHSHVGTGFRAPSLYELYGASIFGSQLYKFGNQNLDPEESLGWDAGIELKALEKKIRFDVTYFSNTFDKIIGFGTLGYENVDGGESKGLEVQAKYTPTDTLSVTGSYTYTDTEDANGEKFFGVPEHELGLNINYRFLEKFNANLSATVSGKEEIPLFNTSTFTSERYKNDGYTKVDIVLDYVLNKHVNIWTRIENLLDDDYTIGGYQAPGISFYGGVKATL
jgi:vitamin B12 transporter